MLTGSCLCSKIHYQIDMDNNINELIFCHCQRCRKWNGSAFNSAMVVAAEKLQILTGQEHIKAFSTNGVNRYFCEQCGSNLFTSRDNMPNVYRFRVGSLDTPIYPIKKIHIYTGSKAEWDSICDGGIEFNEGMK
ncbi:GFA family protein [Orbus mooreae]|uniref:GFA family protein n=1 Tax=Orbus mooreae TaxID=3074107 RepID=UPI00370D57F8